MIVYYNITVATRSLVISRRCFSEKAHPQPCSNGLSASDMVRSCVAVGRWKKNYFKYLKKPLVNDPRTKSKIIVFNKHLNNKDNK